MTNPSAGSIKKCSDELCSGKGLSAWIYFDRKRLIHVNPRLLAAIRIYRSLSPFRISAPRIGLMFCCWQSRTKSHASHVELILVRANAVAPASAAASTNASVEYVPHLKLKYVLQFRYMTNRLRPQS